MKKTVVLAAVFAVATALFAEEKSVSCESELGKCSLTLTDGSLRSECECRDGEGYVSDENVQPETTSLSNETCMAKIEKLCKDTRIRCRNEAGKCTVAYGGNYACRCYKVGDLKTGSGTFSENGCGAVLEEECGSEPVEGWETDDSDYPEVDAADDNTSDGAGDEGKSGGCSMLFI